MINTFLQTLICTSCQIALVLAHVQAHFRGVHSQAGIHVDVGKLFEACSLFCLVSELPTIGLGPIEEVEGLAVQESLVCSICSALHTVEGKMRRHHSKHHPTLPRPTSWKKVKVQRLNNGAAKSWFQILPQKVYTLAEDERIVEDCRKVVQEMWDMQEDKDKDTDARVVNSWLRSTRWHEYVKPYRTEDLRRLVAAPSPEEFPGLKPAVLELLSLAMEALKQIPELVLERLNTPDPAKT